MTSISRPTERLLALASLAGVGPVTLKKIAAIAHFEGMDIRDLASQIPAIAKAISPPAAWQNALEVADQQIEEATRTETRILSPFDPDYPNLLAATKDDPLILYVRGKLSQTPDNSVAVIGTREPTTHGKRIAARIVEFFVENQWSVVSGLAIGCDSIAHQATLDAGGHTVAVLAHGLQTIAPAQNRKLADDILKAGGALVSEYPFGRNIQKQQYVKRDRTQAGFAQGVVMVQSDLIGGSLHASRAALDYNRWLAVPYPTDKDREQNQPKIQANLLISNGSDDDRAELLRCQISDLNRILILRGRDDYLSMLGTSQLGNDVRPTLEQPRNQQPSQNMCSRSDFLRDNKQVKNSGTHSEQRLPSLFEEPNLPTPSSTPSVQSGLNNASTEKSIIDCENFIIPILQVPVPHEANTSWSTLIAEMPSISVALKARLTYLQKIIDTSNGILLSLGSNEVDVDIFIFLLSIEDVLSQLERTSDFLLSIERLYKTSDIGANQQDETPIDRNSAATKKDRDLDLPIMDPTGSDILANLSALLDASTHRLLTRRWETLDEITENSASSSCVETYSDIDCLRQTSITLTDLVTKLNALSKRVLYAK